MCLAKGNDSPQMTTGLEIPFLFCDMPTIPSFELVLIVGNIKPTQVFFQAKSQANFFFN